MPIDITRDVQGLRQAVHELLEESFCRARISKSIDFAGGGAQDAMLASLPPLTLSPGYHRRAEYLLWLDKQKEAGLLPGGFTLSESEGLIAVAEARARFEREHPPCGMCGALQDSAFSTSCHKCGTEFVLRRSA